MAKLPDFQGILIFCTTKKPSKSLLAFTGLFPHPKGEILFRHQIEGSNLCPQLSWKQPFMSCLTMSREKKSSPMPRATFHGLSIDNGLSLRPHGFFATNSGQTATKRQPNRNQSKKHPKTQKGHSFLSGLSACFSMRCNGRGERIRTSDPLHPMQVRYQAALRPVNQRERIIVHPQKNVKGKNLL